MNLKEIKDNAPDGATHYAENQMMGVEYLRLSSNGDWHTFIVKNLEWKKLSPCGVSHANSIGLPLHHTQDSKDPTNPSHYKQGKVECIDAIESAVVGKKGIEASLVGNIIKYLWRYEEKNGVEDVEKAKWYLDKLLEKLK